MKGHVAFCIDSETCKYPELLGIEGENLSAQTWLTLFSDAFELRRALQLGQTWDEIWVLSSDTVDGINVAAALIHDNPHAPINYVSFESSGSVLGRCEAANVKLIRGKNDFAKAYARAKQRYHHEISQQSHISSVPEQDQIIEFEDSWSFEQGGVALGSTVSPQASNHQDSSEPVVTMSASEFMSAHTSGLDIEDSGPLPLSKNSEPHERYSFVKNLQVAIPNMKKDDNSFALAVVSGSGGSGKSTIALISALIYKELGYNVALLDADLQFGDMAYMLGCDNALTISDVLSEPKRLSHLDTNSSLPAVIASPDLLEQSEVIMTQMADLIRFVKAYFDIVVINTGSFWTEQHAQIIEMVDCTLFVLDQRPSSVRSCSRALDLCARCGIATQPFKFVLNYCSRHALLTSIDISCALQGVSVGELKDGGKEVGELLGASLPLELMGGKNAFVQSMREFAISLLPEDKKDAALLQQDMATVSSSRKRNLFFKLHRGRAVCL